MAKKASSKKAKKAGSHKAHRTSLHLLDEANTFIEKHRKAVMAFLFVFSLGLSGVYYWQAHDSPIMSVHKWPNGDMAFFDEWAKKIVAGDWWGDEVLHPYHDWHDAFAEEYFKTYPDVAASYGFGTDGSANVSSKRALINDIYKGKTFHQEPLYTYLIAITYSIFGAEPKWVFMWQILLSALTGVLVFLIGRRYFGALAGLLAAMMVTLCGSVLVYEMTLLRTTMTNFFTVLLLYLFTLALDRKDLKSHLLFGAAGGIALLGQTYFVLFLIPAWLWLIWSQRKDSRKAIVNGAAYACALLLLMSPLMIRNIRAGEPVVSSASNGAMAYIPMNTQEAYPMESFYVHMPSLVRLRHDSEGKLSKAMIESLKTFDSFGAFWRVYRQKIGGLFMWYELPNNMNFYLYREIAPVLKLMFVSYFFIAPVGIAGLLFGLWRHRWKFLPLVFMTVVSMVPMIVAGNLARYRTPLVIMMTLFAAYFMAEVIRLILNKEKKQAFIATGLSILAFIFTSNTVVKDQFVFLGSDLDTFYRYHYLEKLTEYEAKGDYESYLATTTQMVKDLPDYYLNVTASKPIIKGNEAQTSSQVANYLESHLNILKYLNKTSETAYYQDRINILRARVADFNRRLGQR